MPSKKSISRAERKRIDAVTEAILQQGDARDLSKVYTGEVAPRELPLVNEDWKLAAGLAGGLGLAKAGSVASALSGVNNPIARGMEAWGKYAMPSALLDNIGLSAASPYIDAAALSYWSSKGLNASKKLAKEGNYASAIPLAAVSTIPFLQPISNAGKAAGDVAANVAKKGIIRNALRNVGDIPEEALAPKTISAATKAQSADNLPFLEDVYNKVNFKPTIVNSDGSINNQYLLDAYRDVLRYVNKSSPGPKLRMNEPYIGGSREMTLRQHLSDVVKTAQEIPVPKGSTRAELVRSALTHDIGKIITGQEGKDPLHGWRSSDIINALSDKYPEFATDNIKSAVRFHMYNNYDYGDYGAIYGKHGIEDISPMATDFQSGHAGKINYDLVHALQASDVARGLGYDEAAARYPQLFTYHKENPVPVHLYDEPDVIDKVVNPILKRYGYDTIKKGDIPNEKLYEQLRRHRSFLRGARDPKGGGTISQYQKELNVKNAEEAAQRKFGEVNSHTRTATALTDIPKDPTGYGRANLFTTRGGGDGITEHYPDWLAERLKVSPYTQDALYSSVSPQILRTYSSRENGLDGLAARVTLPLEPIKDGESLSSLMERGEWQLYNGRSIHNGKQPMSDWQLYEEPYRLQTGRSLLSDMNEEYHRLNPDVKRWENKKLYETIHPDSEFNNRRIKRLVEFNDRYPLAKYIFGENFSPFVVTDDGGFLYNPPAFSSLDANLQSLNKGDVYWLFSHDLISQKQKELYKNVLRGASKDSEKAQKVYYKYILPTAARNIKDKYYKDIRRITKTSNPEYVGFMKNKIGFMRDRGISPLYEMPSFGKTEMFSTNGTSFGSKPKTKNFSPSSDAGQAIIIGRKGDSVFDIDKIYTPEEVLKLSGPEYKKMPSGRRDAGYRLLSSDSDYAITRKTFNVGGLLANPYGKGGGIHIKPSHRGRFTALLKRTGKPASWFKAHGTPAQKKMATFALNARKWKHEDGGPLNLYPSGGKFITTLAPDREEAFMKDWQAYANLNKLDMNPDNPEHYYDYRGFWNENKRSSVANPFIWETKSTAGHLPDKWKTPGHPTFSVESVYAKQAPGLAGTWENGIYIPPVKVDQDSVKLRQRYAESAFNDRAKSPAGALGAYQIMPDTAKEYARRMKLEGDLMDATYNEMMRDYIWNDFYNSDLASKGDQLDTVRTAKALAMYNWGRGNLANYLNAQKASGADIYGSLDWIEGLPKETRDYINFILLNNDVAGTGKTQEQFEKAAAKYGYEIPTPLDQHKLAKAYGMLQKAYGGDLNRMREALKKIKG